MTTIQFILMAVFAIFKTHSCSAFAPASLKSHPIPSTRYNNPHPPLSIRTSTHLHISNSAHQAEQHLLNQYPKFYYLLQQNPTCLERIRNSSRGFAIFAPSEEAMDALGDSLNLLEYGCNDVDMLPIVQSMASHHVVSVPATVEIMKQFNVVSTSEGELPVQVHEGSIYVNGARIIQCYKFEDSAVRNYEDKDGNLLGSEKVDTGGNVCLVYEMEGMVCPDESWEALYECYQSKNSEAGAM
eukprot:scaffold147063_cov68-Cyclotella_meneghiniana.AAC.5